MHQYSLHFRSTYDPLKIRNMLDESSVAHPKKFDDCYRSFRGFVDEYREKFGDWFTVLVQS